jgi:putative oxidoreductase
MINLRSAPYGVTILRVTLGALFIAHAAIKVFVFTVPGFVGFFGSIGLPPVAAYAVLALEAVGGLALVLGIYVRWFSLLLAIEMVGVIYTHSANGFTFTNKGGGWEYPALWLAALVALAMLGDGAMALMPGRRGTASDLR